MFYFSDYSSLNDIFEFDYESSDPSRSEVKSYMIKMYNKALDVLGAKSRLIPESFDDLASIGLMEPDALATQLHSIWADTAKATTVLCLASNWSVDRMWAHYANAHRGICLEFDFHKDQGVWGEPYPIAVQYVDQRPKISILDILKYAENVSQNMRGSSANDDAVREMNNRSFRTKLSSWSYEGEYRCIARWGGYHRVSCLTPSAIIFGHRSSPEFIRRVRSRSLRAISLERVAPDFASGALIRQSI